MGVKGHQARRAEDDVVVKALKVVLAQLQFGSPVDQVQGLHAHFTNAPLVADGHIAAAA